MALPFVTTEPLECNNRLINGLFHTKCPDVHANEKIIILKLALSDGENFSDLIAYLGEYI